MSNHQASEQMLGYLYQVRCALKLLLENDNSDFQISIEKFDDVAFSQEGVPKQLIQLKRMPGNAIQLDVRENVRFAIEFFKSTKKAIYEAKQQKKSIRNKRIKRIKIVRNIEDIRLKRLIEKQSELHQYRVKGVKIGAVLPLQHERI